MINFFFFFLNNKPPQETHPHSSAQPNPPKLPNPLEQSINQATPSQILIFAPLPHILSIQTEH